MSSDGNGRFYWLKLKKDFFKRHDITIIESMPNGKDYVLFYLKLLCESVDHEGSLRFSEHIPYNEEMLSTITRTNVDIVRSAVKVFSELGMMEMMDDGTFYMTEVQRMIGSAADNDNANRVRRFRERQKELAIESSKNENVTPALQNVMDDVTKSNESKSKRKEIEKEIEIEIEEREKTDYKKVVDLYNETCVSFPKLRALSDARKKAIKARLRTYTLEDFEEVFRKAEASSFLKGGNGRDWSANFDWLLKDGNFAKVLDGNYDDKPKNGGTNQISRAAQELNSFYTMAQDWANSEN